MGALPSCYCQKNFISNQYEIPTIEKQKIDEQHPTKQNFLIYPNLIYGKYSESLEELEFLLQQSNVNISLNQTATFHSNQNSVQQNTSYQRKSLKQQCEDQRNQDNFDCVSVEQELCPPKFVQFDKDTNFKKKKSLSRSLSNFKAQKLEQVGKNESQYKEADRNTVRSILKKKQNQQNKKQVLKRGQSLKCNSHFYQIDDDQSQKTSKSQKKKVQFDPKFVKPKNTNFCY